MTARNQPHKYRCETCDHFGKKTLKINAGKKCPHCDCVLEQDLEVKTCKGEIMHQGMQPTTELVDCASHSDITKAEQRIADAIAKLNSWEQNYLVDLTNGKKYSEISISDIREALALLRGEE